MEAFISFLIQTEVLIASLAFILVLIIYLIVARIIRKSKLKKIHEVEVSANSLRSIPIGYKINKAVGLSKVNENVTERVEKAQQEYAQVTQEIEQLTKLIGDAEDDLLTGKIRNSKTNLDKTLDLYNTINMKVTNLDKELDGLLKDEIRLRDDINQLKDDFRRVKTDYNSKLNLIPLSHEAFEFKMSEIENQFNSFEEWMFASEFSHAQKDYTGIKEAIDFLNQVLVNIVDYSHQTTHLIPSKIDEVKNQYESLLAKGVFLDHLEVLSNIQVVNEIRFEDESNLKELNLENVGQNNQENFTRLQQLTALMEKEDKAYDAVVGLRATVFSLKESLNEELAQLEQVLPELNIRFGFDDIVARLPMLQKVNQSLNELSLQLQDKLANEHLPFTTLMLELSEFNTNVKNIQAELQQANQTIYVAQQAETRAQEQVLNFYLLLNDIQSKIHQRQLPHISKAYKGDVYKANAMVAQINMILAQNPLNIPLLNTNLQEAVDFIYKTFNNVNNLVGTVDMVENAIVYANRYRSISPELDSELTRAEVSFRNGEYTFALTTAIYAIEKFRPNDQYEELIKQNALSA